LSFQFYIISAVLFSHFIFTIYWFLFARHYASAVLAVIVCLSIRLSYADIVSKRMIMQTCT